MDGNNPVEVYGDLESLDYVVVIAYLLFSTVLGVWFYRRGTKDTNSFFIAGGEMPWWLAGFSLLVACFAADSPLWVGDMIYRRGLEGVWMLWAPAIGAAFFVIVIAPLWKRCSVEGIVTDLEFLEFRYSGKAATAMRFVNSIYYSTFFTIMLLAVSTLSIVIIMQATTGFSKATCIIITLSGSAVYCIVSGIWGVASSGFAQFFITFLGSMILGMFSIHKAGGAEVMLDKLGTLTDWPGHEMNIIPKFNATGLPLMTIIFLVSLRWIEQAGIGIWVSQRLFAVKNTRQAIYTAMVWAIGFFAIAPLPWVMTTVASKVVMPDLAVGQEAYPRMAMLLPMGLKGVLIASMLAAFMSTYSSLLSWSSTYAVNDLYRRFLVKTASVKHYVRASQLVMIPIALISGFIAYYAESVLNLLFYVFLATTGYYSISLMRWLWWRVNAWAEVAGLLGSLFFTILICFVFPDWVEPKHMEQYYGHRMIFVSLATLIVSLIVIFMTSPTSVDVLDNFYKKIQPPGLWKPVRRRLGMKSPYNAGIIFGHWIVMMVSIYGPLIGLIKLVLGQVLLGISLILVGIFGCILAVKRVRKFFADEPEKFDPASLNTIYESCQQ